MKDGGSAFPVFEPKYDGTDYACFERGLSLRDWFAGQALAGFIANKDTLPIEFFSPQASSTGAKLCYTIADAMLAEREDEK